MLKWLTMHRSAILATIVVLQNLPGLGNGAKAVLGVAAFAFGGA
jgi:hypothetical protein